MGLGVHSWSSTSRARAGSVSSVHNTISMPRPGLAQIEAEPVVRHGGSHRDDTDAPRRLELGRETSRAVGGCLGTLVSSERSWTSGKPAKLYRLAGRKCVIDQKLLLLQRRPDVVREKHGMTGLRRNLPQPPTPPVSPSPGGRLQRQIHQERSFRMNRERDRGSRAAIPQTPCRSIQTPTGPWLSRPATSRWRILRRSR